jgi:hypothetical protein
MVVAFVAMVVVALLAATPAWASSVSDVRVELYPTNHNHAGEKAVYQVSFTTPSWLGGNDNITIDAPAGTVFPDGDGKGGNLLYTIHDAQATNFIPARNVALSDGGSTVTLNLSGVSVYAPPGTRVTIGNMIVTNPPEPSTYTLDVSTSKDTEPATSAPYTILPALVGGPPPVPEGPTSKEQCKKGGYEEFGFKNQGRCVAFVERGTKNKEGETSS